MVKINFKFPVSSFKISFKDWRKNIGTFIRPLIFAISSIFCGYIAASAASAFSLRWIIGLYNFKETSEKKTLANQVTFSSQLNYHQIKKSILARNVFNADGSFPDEQSDAGSAESATAFNLDAPCSQVSIKIALVGTIYLGDSGNSCALLQDTTDKETDLYRIGDALVGYPDVSVADIDRNFVVLNNKGKKECLELQLGVPGLPSRDTKGRSRTIAATPKSDEVQSVEFDVGFITQQLGEGFGKIIQSARVVPTAAEEGKGGANGFKIFAIEKDSLFDKVGLKDGDVILQVNQTALDPDQGFALYQAFLDEKEINLKILRNGKEPATLQVRIK